MNKYFYLTIIGIIVAALLITALKEYAERQAIKKGTIKKCPHCLEIVDGAATACKHCQRDIGQ
jgi:hypothetical protein